MCGFIGFSGQLAEKEAVLQRMMARIVHRGPDMGGAYTDEDIALGFRRLSILDLSEAGAQPMKSEDGNVVVTFNGEIYNFGASPGAGREGTPFSLPCRHRGAGARL